MIFQNSHEISGMVFGGRGGGGVEGETEREWGGVDREGVRQGSGADREEEGGEASRAESPRDPPEQPLEGRHASLVPGIDFSRISS